MKKFVLFVMLMMSVVSVSAQRWSLTPEVGMTAVKRGGFSYIDEPGYTWNDFNSFLFIIPDFSGIASLA